MWTGELGAHRVGSGRAASSQASAGWSSCWCAPAESAALACAAAAEELLVLCLPILMALMAQQLWPQAPQNMEHVKQIQSGPDGLQWAVRMGRI